MSRYYASMLVPSVTGQVMRGSGSFVNITIDGRLSEERAVAVARRTFRGEALLKNQDYMGFIVQRSLRAWEYTSPMVVDNDIPAKDIMFL